MLSTLVFRGAASNVLKLGLWMLLLSTPGLVAQDVIVRDGVGCSEIIIADDAPRSTRLAAQELQRVVEKISGTKLRIASEPSKNIPVRLYVGQSPATEKLGITADGLKYGAYRIVSGEDWLVFIGDDTDFVPIEPWPRAYDDIRSGKMQAEWDKITGEHSGYPHSQLYKHYSGSRIQFGTPEEEKVDKDGNVNVWTFDERGSFNAVCGFLRGLGVRWYMPGEVGEVVPKMPTIALPQIDETVRPDFPLRTLNFRPAIYGRDVMMWSFHLGVRQPFGRQAAHGLHHLTHNEYTLTHHPDWFALYGEKRHTQFGQRLNQLCYSNDGLFRAAVCYAQVQFDHYDMDVVSIMPPDGYTAMCQCELCKGKDTPERGYRGMLSDYVWDFVNRVAKEIGKSHPGKRISNCAYGTYTEPPLNIDKLESNVQVIIVGGRRPTSPDRDEVRKLREAWAKKTDRPIEVFENYPFTGRGFYLPAYVPHVMGESINATKGMSRGEDVWLTMNFKENAVGYNHFLVYFTARMYWGGKQQDAVAMFDEYCRLFYGPAGSAMRAFFAYCEDNWRDMEKDAEKTRHALDLFATAKAGAPADSIYGRRLGFIDNYLNGLRNKCVQLEQKRGPVPLLRLVGDSSAITVDGKLDEAAWQKCPVASTGRLRELQTGSNPTFGTTFKTIWRGNDLYFAIRCDEHPGERLNIGTTRNGDQATWYGDGVEILLDTDSHSYYQIVVNPSGALIDLDRGAPPARWYDWHSKAEVATLIADDHWNIEIRIPIVQDENDPLHQVIGHKPTQSLPWHINICRQRIRENGEEYSAFAPTAQFGFHVPMKFARFYTGLHAEFEADPTVTDYIIAESAAAKLARSRDTLPDAIAAYIALAESVEKNDFQISAAFEKGAACARNLRDFDQAQKLAGRIPIDAVANVVRMENLLAMRKPQEVVDTFGKEDISTWPFWKQGEACFLRGRAFSTIGSGPDAERDFAQALKFTNDTRTRMNIWLSQGDNRVKNLKDSDGALEAYRQIAAFPSHTGSATYFRGLQGAARILGEKGEHDEALAILQKVDMEKLQGYWYGSMHLALGDALATADRVEEALVHYRKILNAKGVPKSVRNAAEKAVAKFAK